MHPSAKVKITCNTCEGVIEVTKHTEVCPKCGLTPWLILHGKKMGIAPITKNTNN